MVNRSILALILTVSLGVAPAVALPALSPEPTSEPLETLLRLRLIEQIPDLGDRLASLLQLVDILTPASAS
ncbi:MAG: hypothetical protein AAF289_22100, partial [Cyanobacteria bacterium P01_A01_bin.135]